MSIGIQGSRLCVFEDISDERSDVIQEEGGVESSVCWTFQGYLESGKVGISSSLNFGSSRDA